MTEMSDALDRYLEELGFEVLTEDDDEVKDGETLVMVGGWGPMGYGSPEEADSPVKFS